MSSIPNNWPKPLAGSQQGIIFVVGCLLVALLVWRSGLGRLSAAPLDQPQKKYFVEIIGAVARPGTYSFSHPPELKQVWARAEGPSAPPIVTHPLASGSRITVAQDGSYTRGYMSGANLLVLGLTIDLNRANVADLKAIPGIGPVLAARIIKYRETYGPFTRLKELITVKGIGPKNFEQIQPFLEISSNPPGFESKWE